MSKMTSNMEKAVAKKMVKKKASSKGGNWIAGAIKHPGALTASAPASAKKKGGGLKSSWVDAQAKKGGTIGKRARLAKTLRKMH